MLAELRNRIGGLDALLVIALIVAATAAAVRLSAAVIARARAPRGDGAADQTRRRTLQPLLESAARYVLYFIALVMILRELNVDATAILASAGVLGFAVGFGAQSLIRDVIAGFFLLSDGLIQVGDVIVFDGHSGLVERIGIRTTQLRKFNGELWTIPNGALQVFGNLNRGFARAIVEVGVAYEGDVERAMAVMHQVGEAWAAERTDIVLGPPEVQGILQFGEAGMVIRLVAMVRPLQQWDAERELRRRIKAAFDREGIEIPAPRRLTFLRGSGAEPAPPDVRS